MTLEEAIRHAEEKAKCGGQCGEDHAQLAEWLKELQKLRTVKTEKRNGKSAQNVPKEDLISRKAAIDAVNGVIADYIPTLYGRYEALPLEMAMAIKRLPTAQPEKHTEERTETHTCDLISRQKAIDALENTKEVAR